MAITALASGEEFYYQFIDEKDALDVPELVLWETYIGNRDDGQLVDIYDRQSRSFIGTYCTERFQKGKR